MVSAGSPHRPRAPVLPHGPVGKGSYRWTFRAARCGLLPGAPGTQKAESLVEFLTMPLPELGIG